MSRPSLLPDRDPEPDSSSTPPSESVSSVSTPVEATIRILLNSVPYLIGAAVVRQPSGPASLVAQVGRVPWLFDRRLIALDLSDESLPPNEAVVLDWPVPHQAEWVGVAPRLLMARLVAFEQTVGVLLGTLLTRELLMPKTREALDLSCQLIASAVATDTAMRAGERQSRRLRVLNDVQRALSGTFEARQLGRILRDTMNEVTEAAAFAVSLFHSERAEVLYRYRVVDVDALANELGRQAVDDGPGSRAATQRERWLTFQREVEMPVAGDSGRTERQQVSVLQLPMLANAETIGVVTLQTFRMDGFGADERDLIADIVDASANYFGNARRMGALRPDPAKPRFTLTAEPAVPAAATAAGPAPDESPPDATPEEPTLAPRPAIDEISPSDEAEPSLAEVPPRPLRPVEMPAPIPLPPRDPDEILRELVTECTRIGEPNAFVVVVDARAGLLRGRLVSDSPTMQELDEALGITRGQFVIPLDSRFNAIARACREGRDVTSAWMYEIVQPLFSSSEALVFERLAHGGRTVVVPVQVGGEVAAAIVIGPSPDDTPAHALERARALADAAADELAAAWRTASLAGGRIAPAMADDTILRLQALLSEQSPD